MAKLTTRLARNAVDFLLSGEVEKSNACMSLLEVIKDKGLENVKGKLSVDNL
jgi:hypothetical protein